MLIPTDSPILGFRLATPEDAPQLAALISAAFRSEKTGQTWLYDSQERRVDIASGGMTSSFISDPNMIMLVGVYPDNTNNAVTTCFLKKPSDLPEAHVTPGAAWLGFLAVSPDTHKRGLGLQTLREAERYVRDEWGVGRLEFDFVNTRSELRAWYERNGYAATGATRPFPYGEKGREILREGLEMVVLGKDLR